MTEWEPHEHFKNAIASDYESFIAGAEAYRAHLASQCGDDPCVGCKDFEERNTPSAGCYFAKPEKCDKYAGYQMVLAERAKCEAEKAALAWEIVGFIRELSPATKAIADTVERWLASRGIERP